MSAFKCILFKGIIGEIYNIGIEKEYTVLEITDKLIDLIYPNADNKEKYYRFVKDREYNDQRYFISIEKLKKLGWSPKINIDEGLKTVKYYFDKFN